MSLCGDDLTLSGLSGPSGALAGDRVALRSNASMHRYEVREAMPM